MTKTSESYGYNSAFPITLRKLMEDRNVTRKKLSEICSVKAQSVSQWANGETRPDILSLTKIAEFFNVSTDYILGLTDVQTPDIATKELCLTLGLSEDAVKILSADPSSTIGERWVEEWLHPLPSDQNKTREEILDHREECIRKTLDGISNDVIFVFNRLIDDYTKAEINNIQHINNKGSQVRSIISLIKQFYNSIDATSFDIVEHGTYSPIDKPIILGTTQCGEEIILPIEIKGLMTDLAINCLITRLNNIKFEMLAENIVKKEETK